MTGQSETKHTPGKLKVFDAPNGKVIGIGRASDGYAVADAGFGIWGENSDEARANAARIALTWNCHDELVAACQAVVDACTSAPPMDLIKRLGECADKCAAALAKASA